MERLPPGQRWVEHLIPYDIGPVPGLDMARYRLKLTGAVAQPVELTWEQFLALRHTQVRQDFHCVTGWSVRDLEWEGVPTRAVVDLVRPHADVRWVLAVGREGYTTNVPYDHFLRENSLLAHRLSGKPLAPENGAPVRLVVPSLYAWKSAKYLVELRFMPEMSRGFWEERGYHDVGDPWQEQRRWR